MGFLLCALLWGGVLLEEIECIPPEEWKEDGLKKVLLLRRTRTQTAFLLTLAVSALFFCVEVWIVWAGRSTGRVAMEIDQIPHRNTLRSDIRHAPGGQNSRARPFLK